MKIEWKWSAGVANYFWRPGAWWFGWRATWGGGVNGEPPTPENSRIWCWTLTVMGISVYLQVDKIVRLPR